MSVFNLLNSAIHSKLAANSSLTTLLGGTALYPLQAPEIDPPFVVWNTQAGGDDNSTAIQAKDITIYVRGYASSYGLAGSVAAEIYTSLHDQALTVTGWNNFWCTSIQDIDLVENSPGGETRYSAGGLYRIRLDK